MYEIMLFCHNWFRWIVVFALIGVCFNYLKALKSKSKFLGEFRSFKLLQEFFGHQIGFGLGLYIGLSPFVKHGISNPEDISDNEIIRFWTLYHGPMMILSFLILVVSFQVMKKRPEKRVLVMSITSSISLILIFLAIPWPWLEYGRPWFRFFWFDI